MQDVSSVFQKDAVHGNKLQLPGRPVGFADKSCYLHCRDHTVKHVLQALHYALPFSCSVYLVLMQAQLKLPPPTLFNRLWMFVSVLLQTQLISRKGSQNPFQLRIVFSCELY